LGGIVDFVGIKFPKKDDEASGYVHFIDIKTGKAARLTPDQRKFKKLLDASKVNFRTVKIDDIETK
jgi:predicted Holliday junction resolvase-like endonuclease